MSIPSSSGRRPITVAAGGTIETALLPYHIVHLLKFLPVIVRVALSSSAQRFVTPLALEGITRQPVYTDIIQLDAMTHLPLHMLYAEGPVVLYPASPRILAECALGIVSCPVTQVFAFADKASVLICPALHPRCTKWLYEDHLRRLETLGCTVLGVTNGEFMERATWDDVEKGLSLLLDLELAPRPSEVYTLSEGS